MGTSANLWVKSAGKNWVQHTSYDGSASQVFAEVGATIAAAGLDALRQSIAQAVIAEDDGDMDQTRSISLQVGAEAYFNACQARSQQPVGLLGALRDRYGLHDFAHAGIIPLMGKPLVHDGGFCSEISNADFVLDLDAGTLVALIYEDFDRAVSHGDQQTVPGWTLPLEQLEGLDPERVHEVFHQTEFNAAQPADLRQAVVENALEAARLPSLQDAFAGVPDLADRLGGGGDRVIPGCYQFLAHAADAASIRMVIGMLQRCGERAAVLNEPGVLLAQMVPDQSNAVSLTVDLRKQPAEKLAPLGRVLDILGMQCQMAGMEYRMGGNGSFAMHGPGMSMASASTEGFDEAMEAMMENLDDELDEGFGAMFMPKVEPPQDAAPVRTQATRLADIAEDAASMSAEAVGYLQVEKMMARASFDGEVLASIPPSVRLTAEQSRLSNILINAVGPLEDAILPGARRARFLGLPPAVQEEILGSFKPLGRFVLGHDLDLPPPTAPRRPAP